MKKILITGGAGFIGSNLSQKLLEQGEAVIVLDNFITSHRDNVQSLLEFPNFIFIQHDITQPFNTEQSKILEGISEIYHLACPTGVPNLVKLGYEMLMTCTVGTKNILNLAKKNSSKILFTSSSEVYGNPEVTPQSEQYTGNVDSTGIRSTYEEGKRVAESFVSFYTKIYGLNGKIVRIFNTYGPKMSHDDTRVIPLFFSCITRQKPLPVHGNGTQTRTFCYVDDIIQGLLNVMDKGAKGEVYNLGSDREISISNLAELMIKITNSSSKMQYTKRPSHDHNSRMPNLEKIKKIGWKQNISLEEGLKKTFLSLSLKKSIKPESRRLQNRTVKPLIF